MTTLRDVILQDSKFPYRTSILTPLSLQKLIGQYSKHIRG